MVMVRESVREAMTGRAGQETKEYRDRDRDYTERPEFRDDKGDSRDESDYGRGKRQTGRPVSTPRGPRKTDDYTERPEFRDSRDDRRDDRDSRDDRRDPNQSNGRLADGLGNNPKNRRKEVKSLWGEITDTLSGAADKINEWADGKPDPEERYKRVGEAMFGQSPPLKRSILDDNKPPPLQSPVRGANAQRAYDLIHSLEGKGGVQKGALYGLELEGNEAALKGFTQIPGTPLGMLSSAVTPFAGDIKTSQVKDKFAHLPPAERAAAIDAALQVTHSEPSFLSKVGAGAAGIGVGLITANPLLGVATYGLANTAMDFNASEETAKKLAGKKAMKRRKIALTFAPNPGEYDRERPDPMLPVKPKPKPKLAGGPVQGNSGIAVPDYASFDYNSHLKAFSPN